MWMYEGRVRGIISREVLFGFCSDREEKGDFFKVKKMGKTRGRGRGITGEECKGKNKMGKRQMWKSPRIGRLATRPPRCDFVATDVIRW